MEKKIHCYNKKLDCACTVFGGLTKIKPSFSNSVKTLNK